MTKVTNSSQVVTKLLQIILLLLEWRHRHVKNQWQTNFDLFRRTHSHDSSIWLIFDGTHTQGSSHRSEIMKIRSQSKFAEFNSVSISKCKVHFSGTTDHTCNQPDHTKSTGLVINRFLLDINRNPRTIRGECRSRVCGFLIDRKWLLFIFGRACL